MPQSASSGGTPTAGDRPGELDQLKKTVADLERTIDRLRREHTAVAADPATSLRRLDFGYRMLLALMGRTTSAGTRVDVPTVAVRRENQRLNFTFGSAESSGKRAEVQAGDRSGNGPARLIEVVTIDEQGHASTRTIGADRDIDSVLVLDDAGRVLAVGPRLPASPVYHT